MPELEGSGTRYFPDEQGRAEMPDDPIQAALKATREIVAELDKRSRASDQVLIQIQADLRQVTETSQRLANLIWTGNGADSLMTRVTLLEGALGRLEEDLREEQDDREKEQERREDAKAKESQSEGRIKTAWITSIVSMVTAIACALIALSK